MRLIDQRRLPARLRFLDCGTVGELSAAISSLVVRGAPALGAAGGYGVAWGPRTARTEAAAFRAAERAAAELIATRPTAVNLAWGARGCSRPPGRRRVGGGRRAAGGARRGGGHRGRGRRHQPAPSAPTAPRWCRPVPPSSPTATPAPWPASGYGTALGVIRAAAEAGGHVWVDETRPVLQGARLTAWELGRLGIDATLVADAMAGSLHGRGRGRPGGGGRRPGRRQRRRGQQDRHLPAGRPGRPPRRALLRGRPHLDRRPGHARPAPASPSRSATRAK